MFYDKQPEQNREKYKEMLKIVGSLSRLFSESENPYLHYRAHENIFSKYFGLQNNARSDDSADAYSIEEKIGIGLKTWVGLDNQKVAEFGKLRPQYQGMTGLELVKKVSEYRNVRIRTTMNLHGLNVMLYHIVKRIPNAMCIYECSFDYIDIPNIVLLDEIGNENNIYFSDGKHTYHFSLSKNTLYMIFDKMQLLDKFDVQIYDDPYDFLSNVVLKENQCSFSVGDVTKFVTQNAPRSEQLCLRLYSIKGNKKFVAQKSGLNQWNADGRVRDENEIYIPYPVKDRKRGNFFPDRDKPFDLLLPDGQIIKAKVCQQDGKAIMSNPNKLLGKWLLRDVLELPSKTLVTYEMLQVFGIDSVIFTKIGNEKYSVNFCPLGTYEEFYNLDEE